MLAMQFLGSAQRHFNGDVLVGCLDSEESITTVRMSNLGVRYPKIKPYNDMTIEKVFKYIEGLCLYKEMKNIVDKPSIVMWDSVANTQTMKERESEDPNSLIGYRGRLLSLLIPKYVSKIAHYNIIVLAINQLRDSVQIGPMTQAKDLNFMRMGKTIPGGNALRYNSFHLVDLKIDGTMTNKLPEKYGFDGIVAEVKAVKNKLFAPNIPIKLVGNFLTGFSNFWTNYVFMCEAGYIKTGAWNYFTEYPNIKWHTRDAESMYNSDPDMKEVFDSNIKTAILKEIVEKNTVVI
jgi:RecA/RadA recombinase